MMVTGLKAETNENLQLELADAAFFGASNGQANARAIIQQVAARVGLVVTIQ